MILFRSETAVQIRTPSITMFNSDSQAIWFVEGNQLSNFGGNMGIIYVKVF